MMMMMKRLVLAVTVWPVVNFVLMNPLTTRERRLKTYTLDEVEIGSPLEPLSNYLLVRVASAMDSTTGGVLLPEQSKEKPTEGVVVAAGPGRTHPDTGVLMEMPIETGANVMYGKYDGTSVKYNGEDHQLIRDDDVLLTWRGDLTLENVEPVADRVLLKTQQAEEETASGIALAPGVAEQQKTSVGQVLKLGVGRLSSDGTIMPMPVLVGDFVKYRTFSSLLVLTLTQVTTPGARLKLGRMTTSSAG